MNIKKQSGYNGNPNLTKAGTKHNWTPEMKAEFIKCKNDPVYFARKYFKIVHVDDGLVPLKLYEFQEEAINLYAQGNRKIALNTSRQIGKCVTLNTILKLRKSSTGEEYDISCREFMRLILESAGYTVTDNDYENIVLFTFAFGKFKE